MAWDDLVGFVDLADDLVCFVDLADDLVGFVDLVTVDFLAIFLTGLDLVGV